MILPLTYRRYGGFYQTVYCCAIGMTGKKLYFSFDLQGVKFYSLEDHKKKHIISQEDKTMKHTDPQRLMTYSQWCKIFKYRLKKYIRRKLYNGLQWLLFILFMVGIPYGMIVHWLFFGY